MASDRSDDAERSGRRWMRAMAIGIAIASIALLVMASSHFNQTYDEETHLAAGLNWWQYGRSDVDQVHPPLARIFIALGPALAGVRLHGNATVWLQGNAALLAGGHYHRTLALARAGVLPFFVLLLAVVWAWTRALADERAALLAVALTAATPPLLAHAGIATNDLPLAAMVTWAFYALVRWLERPDVPRTTVLAIAGGGAVVTKLSSIPFFGLGAILIIAARFLLSRRRNGRDPSLLARAYLRPLVGASVGAGLLVWATYGFHVHLARGWLPVPAPELLAGIRALARNNGAGRPAYLLGNISKFGWWYYFWVVLAVKTPLPLMMLSLIALVWTLAARAQRSDWRSLAPWLAVVAIMTVASASNIDIGVRHILPVYPLLIVPAAIAAIRLWDATGPAPRSLVRSALGALVLGQAVTTIRTYPDFLPAFNAFAGAHPDRVLLDSNLDWGQDLYRLADTLQARRIDAVTLFYFGSTPVGAFPLADTVRIGGAERASGWIGVSRTFVHGLYSTCFTWISAYRPVARIGQSMLLYHLLPDTVARIPREAQPVASPVDQYGTRNLGPAHPDDLCRQPRVEIDAKSTVAGSHVAPAGRLVEFRGGVIGPPREPGRVANL